MPSLLPSVFNRDSLLRDPLVRFPNFPNLLQEFEKFSEERELGLTIYDEKDTIVVEVAAPGLKRDEIEVYLNKGVLWVKGEKEEEKTDKNKNFYAKSVRSFSRSIALPGQIDENQKLEAFLEDGVLKIVFQKAKNSDAKRIAIKNKGSN